MKHGFFNVGTASPEIRVGDPMANAQILARAAEEACSLGLRVLVFPELSLTSATAGDLLAMPAMLASAEAALEKYLALTEHLDLVTVLGLPFSSGSALYNVAAVTHAGSLYGLVPKSGTTLFANMDGARIFSPAPSETLLVSYAGFDEVPLSRDLLFTAPTMPSLVMSVELGSDSVSPLPPSVDACREGATLILRPAATPSVIGANARTEAHLASASARLCAAIASANAGFGESGTDLVFDGECALFSAGRKCEAKCECGITYATLDLETLLYLRRRDGFPCLQSDRGGYVPIPLGECETAILTPPRKNPFLPPCREELRARCREILTHTARALAARARRAYASSLVLGVSGGLDSTLALLVAHRAARDAGISVTAVTMPGFGTTSRTKSNAQKLSEALNTRFLTVDITPAVKQHFADIGHDENNRNVVYENAQARERTQILMDIANAEGGFVVGTGDLSELALGFATYNGDHMSMYGVNAGIPKTLMRHIVAVYADDAEAAGELSVASILRDVLATPVSPELLPPTEEGEIAQCTEGIVGPYELHDFFLYYTVRAGFAPDKLLRLTTVVFREDYSEETILGWLRIFIRRFFAQQFKRSCLPDGPRVGSLSLSPRGGLWMPSDSAASAWLAMLDNPPAYRKDGTTLG